MSEADAQVWQSRRRDAVVIPLDVVAQHQAIDIRLVGNHSRSGFGCPHDSLGRFYSNWLSSLRAGNWMGWLGRFPLTRVRTRSP
jgi:hypothetical protein